MGLESTAEEQGIEDAAFEAKRLASRIANLCDQDDWPERLYSRLAANEALDHIQYLDGESREALSAWVDRAANESRAISNDSLWAACPAQFKGEFATSQQLQPRDLLEKACSILAGEVPWKSAEDQLAAVENTLASASAEQREAVLQWAEDVVATNEAGGNLRDNGGTLLNVPEPLREFFDWEAAEAAALEIESEKPVESPKKPRNRQEALRCLLDRIPSAVAALDVAERLVSERDASLKSAKKILEAEEENLHALNREYVRVLEGGDYQQLLPFEESEDAATASPEPAAKSGGSTDFATHPASDEAATWSIHELVTDRLKEKTSGKSVDADGKSTGISESTADMLTERGFGTIGLLEAHMRQHGEFWQKRIKGVGDAKAQLIRDALACLRSCFPQPAVDTEPLEELVLDRDAYQLGVLASRAGKPRDCAYCENGHQGRSWLKGYDDAASTEGGE